MISPYGLEITESCLTCKVRSGLTFCDLPKAALRALEAIKFSGAYAVRSLLFAEGQPPRGVFILCKGHVKLSFSTRDGKTLIPRIAGPGEVLGASATIVGKPYELSAETIDPCQVNFVKREDFLRFLHEYPRACFQIAEELSDKYITACREIRSLVLPHSAEERLAKLLLEWNSKHLNSGKQLPGLRITLTHEEMAQMIGTSRETVTRIFAELKKRRIVCISGSTVQICDKAALASLAGSR